MKNLSALHVSLWAPLLVVIGLVLRNRFRSKRNPLRPKPVPALIQETLRFRARGVGPRLVMHDTTLSDGVRDFHLEEDSIVLIAHNAMHFNPSAWGENADQFIAGRFLPGNKVPTAAFRGFGGGANACPGKGFAMAEIAAFVAMLVMRWDLKPIEGEWVEPGVDVGNVTREVAPPGRKIAVELVPRKGGE